MSHDRDLADQDVEELAEEIWTLAEEGRDDLAELRARSQVEDVEGVLGELVRRGLVAREGACVRLSEAGRKLAARQVRRHRLAEALFTTVLEVRDEEAVNRAACVIEHVLDAALADSVCAFLGHPPHCPHGKPIPPGACCRAFNGSVEPLVQPLARLPVGQTGQIVYIAPRQSARLLKLSSLGVLPGATVQLQQKTPATVLRIGETTLALDPEIAGEIYVKRSG